MTTPLTPIPARHADLKGLLPAQALPAEAVQTDGDQSIGGTKSFTAAIGTPTIDHGTQGGTLELPTPRTLLSFANRDPLHGDWSCFIGGGPFDGQHDPVFYLGCNINRDPSRPGRNDQPTLSYNLEYDYFEAFTGKRTAEGYPEFLSPFNDGLNRFQRRPWMFTMDRATGSTRFVIEAGPELAEDDPAHDYFGYAEVVGGPAKGGSYSMGRFTSGSNVDTATVAFNSPVTVRSFTGSNTLLCVQPSIAADVSSPGFQHQVGTDPSLGPLQVSIGGHTSAVGGSRYGWLGAGDAFAIRTLVLSTNGNGNFGRVAIGGTSAINGVLEITDGLSASIALTKSGSLAGAATITNNGNLVIASSPAQDIIYVTAGTVQFRSRDFASTFGTFSSTGLNVSGLAINGSSPITKWLSASASLNFGSIGAGAQATATISVTGAVAGDCVVPGFPAGLEAGLSGNMIVTAPDTVTVRLTNTTGSPISPAVATFKCRVTN